MNSLLPLNVFSTCLSRQRGFMKELNASVTLNLVGGGGGGREDTASISQMVRQMFQNGSAQGGD